ncbi:MAG: hypothetical protein HYZ53_27570 [Planctomycetes bacterium]|nr:hypothetical protein [Planctomycetota bacterium]
MAVSVLDRLKMGWGKLRRQYLIRFRKGYVEQSLSQRFGECLRCGACCKLMFDCFFCTRGLPTGCKIYSVRPMACRFFPIDERDLEDRNLVLPNVPCGFYFAPREKAAERPQLYSIFTGKEPTHAE